jgi:hypothetical protein
MPSIDSDRRTVLAGLAAAVAGCAGNGATSIGSPTDSPTGVHTTTVTGTESASDTPSSTLTLEPVPPREVDENLTVYPSDLREWIRTAATTDRTVRAHAETPSYAPSPPLPAFDRVRVDDESSELAGSYDLSVEGDTRYRLLVGAEEAAPPADAEVTPVSSLAEQRREVAQAASGGSTGDSARVYPETELGSWVRHAFFGGYYSHEGTTYRGTEAKQTDAEFFATEVWYVLSAASVDAPSADAIVDSGQPERRRRRRGVD